MMIQDTLCDVWWFPGTNDPDKPCYGYWNAKDDETTPMRFFGLSSLGPSILDYFDFKPGMLPPGILESQYPSTSAYIILCQSS